MAFQFTENLRVYKQILDRIREMTLGLILGKNTYSSKNISKLYYSYKDFSLCMHSRKCGTKKSPYKNNTV